MIRLVPALLAAAFFGVGPAQAEEAAPLAPAVREAAQSAPGLALGAVAVRCAGGIDTAQDGPTRADGHDPLSPDARFNIGSNAKSMLASLAAVLVADGVIGWDTEVGAVFAAEAATLDPVLRHATLAQLLSHRSGAPAYSSGADLSALTVAPGDPGAQRLAVALQILRGPPAHAPGTQTLYSNAGYIIAGAMLERVGGAPFDTLMRERLFAPLGMTHTTFGDPTTGEAGQPLGHHLSDGVRTVYLDAEPAIPPFLQPAGNVSLSLHDYGLYLREHLCGLTGGPTRALSPEAVRFLHRPQGEDGVALGWGAYAFDGVPASIHVGGTGIFSAFVAVLPDRDIAVATVVNSGDPEGRQAALSLLQTLVADRLAAP